jgi:ATP/maltotriose-dependent transcriptional regulator MalT
MTKLKAVPGKTGKKADSRARSTPRTRLAPPPSRGKQLSRPGLEEYYAQLQQQSFTLLVAPQGYGKTHVLSSWHAALLDSGTRPIWITLDDRDNEPGKLACVLLDACAPLLPSGHSGPDISPNESAGESIQQLCNLLQDSEEKLVIMIDQYETLTDPGARELFTDFLFNLPPAAHRVLASTSTPQWMTPKLQLEEGVQILNRETLAFSAPELEEFMRLEGHESLSDEDIHSLMNVTGGWPAALKLASLSLNKAKTPREHADIVHGVFPLLYEYLDRNIISELAPPLRAFLQQTAHLKRLRVDLCNYVCGSDDAGDCLSALLDMGLLEGNHYADNWFSYPPLLHNFLLRQLQKEGRSNLAERHCLASDWYLEFGLTESSFYHALEAQDYDRAVAIHSAHSRDLIVAGGAALIEQFIKTMPQKMFDEHPYILWPYTWMLVISQRFTEANKHLPELQSRLEAGVQDKSSDPLTPAPEDLKVIEYRIKQALDRDWTEPAVWLKLKKTRGSKDDFLQEQIELSLGSAYLRCNKFSDAYAAFHEAKRLADLNHTPITTVSATTRMAEIRYMQGQLTEAMYLCTEAMDLAALVPGQLSSFTGIPLLLSSRILFDRNQLAESEQSFYEGRNMFRMYRASHYLMDSAVHRARLANASSGWQSALHTLEET